MAIKMDKFSFPINLQYIAFRQHTIENHVMDHLSRCPARKKAVRTSSQSMRARTGFVALFQQNSCILVIVWRDFVRISENSQ